MIFFDQQAAEQNVIYSDICKKQHMSGFSYVFWLFW